MLATERRRAIEDLVHKRSSVRVKDLCTALEASPSTIRRDLEQLERKGILQRSYGGATAVRPRADAPPALEEDDRRSVGCKIGAAAARLIGEGETVFLGAGALAMAAARNIATRPDIAVVTNALNIAAYLTEHASLRVIVTGGQVDRQDGALLGHVAELALRELRADRAIIEVGGLHVPDGLTGNSLAEVQLIRALIDTVPEVVVLADAQRWGHIAPAFLAPLDAIDVIVTDLDAPPAMVWDLAQLGIKVVQT